MEQTPTPLTKPQEPKLPTPPPSPPKPLKKSFVTSLMEAATLRSTSFKEDSYLLSSLKPSMRKSLQDLKNLLSSTNLQESSIWGIPLSSSGADDLGFKELEGVVAYMNGCDREGHPVCYNAYGVFKDKEMYERIFGDDEKLKRFLRWRVQVLERGISLLQFKPGGVNSIIQVTDLKDMPKRELRVASNQILSLFQDNYPELVAKKIFINVPWYFSVLYSMFSPFLTQRTKSKFVIAREGFVAETLYKYIRPEYVPVQHGGLSRPGDGVHGATITWDIVVGGWDLDYGAEYVPLAKDGYTVSIEKSRRITSSDEPIHNSYTSREPGKMVLSIDNTSSRRRKVAAYRYFVQRPSI
ncbi:Patellin-6 [Acorus calamus]|uniref:Patellin-6 n=1 Tax=Acorus calamus TaxID=4465 RepID=A0AAV9EFY4_ACOCL|nr:Patellin-6 [Acorus calamus]